MVRSLQVCRDHLEQSTLLCPTSLCSRTVSFKTNSRQTQVHLERKPPKKANSHLDLCTSLSLSVPCLGQQKQPVRIWPSLVFPLYPFPEPPQRKKLTRKGNITKKKKKKKVFQSLEREKRNLPVPLLRENLSGAGLSQRVPASCPPSLSQLSVPLPKAAGGGGRAEPANDAPQSVGCLPRSTARCLLFKLLNILY